MDDKGSWAANINDDIERAHDAIRDKKSMKALVWQIGALIRYHYKVDPETLTHAQIIQYYTELRWIREEEAKASQSEK